MRNLGESGAPASGAAQTGGQSAQGERAVSVASGRAGKPSSGGGAAKSKSRKSGADGDKPNALLDKVETRLDGALERLGSIEAVVGGRKDLD